MARQGQSWPSIACCLIDYNGAIMDPIEVEVFDAKSFPFATQEIAIFISTVFLACALTILFILFEHGLDRLIFLAMLWILAAPLMAHQVIMMITRFIMFRQRRYVSITIIPSESSVTRVRISNGLRAGEISLPLPCEAIWRRTVDLNFDYYGEIVFLGNDTRVSMLTVYFSSHRLTGQFLKTLRRLGAVVGDPTVEEIRSGKAFWSKLVGRRMQS